MYSVTIKVSTAAELTKLTTRLEELDIPAFLRSEIKKTPKTDKPETVKNEDTKEEVNTKTSKPAKSAKTEKQEDFGATYDDVKEATFKLAGLPGDGPRLVKAVLAMFNVDHATKLTEKQWKGYVDEANKRFEENMPEENLA